MKINLVKIVQNSDSYYCVKNNNAFYDPNKQRWCYNLNIPYNSKYELFKNFIPDDTNPNMKPDDLSPITVQEIDNLTKKMKEKVNEKKIIDFNSFKGCKENERCTINGGISSSEKYKDYICLNLKSYNSNETINILLPYDEEKDIQKILNKNVTISGYIGCYSHYKHNEEKVIFSDISEIIILGDMYNIDKFENKKKYEDVRKNIIQKVKNNEIIRICVISKETAEGYRDFKDIVDRKKEKIELINKFIDSITPNQVKEKIEEINNKKICDIICIVRGGGNKDVLTNFNNEELFYSIWNSNIPILIGIGHSSDKDYLLCGKVAEKNGGKEFISPTEVGYEIIEFIELAEEEIRKEKLNSSLHKQLDSLFNNFNKKHRALEIKTTIIIILLPLLCFFLYYISNQQKISKEELVNVDKISLSRNDIKVVNKQIHTENIKDEDKEKHTDIINVEDKQIHVKNTVFFQDKDYIDLALTKIEIIRALAFRIFDIIEIEENKPDQKDVNNSKNKYAVNLFYCATEFISILKKIVQEDKVDEILLLIKNKIPSKIPYENARYYQNLKKLLEYLELVKENSTDNLTIEKISKDCIPDMHYKKIKKYLKANINKSKQFYLIDTQKNNNQLVADYCNLLLSKIEVIRGVGFRIYDSIVVANEIREEDHINANKYGYELKYYIRDYIYSLKKIYKSEDVVEIIQFFETYMIDKVPYLRKEVYKILDRHLKYIRDNSLDKLEEENLIKEILSAKQYYLFNTFIRKR